jgi:RNA polymerase sigma-70 factor, ECF subfamily
LLELSARAARPISVSLIVGSLKLTESDLQLVERSRRGDRAAFEQIVHQTARLVYARLALDIPDRHRAEDLTQEVYLTAWRCIRDLDRPTALRAWLLAIAASVAADDARRLGRKKRGRPATGSLDFLADNSPNPAEATEASDEQSRALEALRGLPKEYRQPLTLRYLSGADYETISRQLALSNGALRGLLHRGLALLRKRLND